jgi:hypothetical protein
MTSPANTTGSLRIKPGQLCAWLGVGAAAFSIWLLPIVLGVVGIGFGIAAVLRGEPRGKWVILLAAVCMPIGLLVAWLPDDILGS